MGVGWTSPIEGRVRIRGLVKDGHPFGNGVGWKLVHKRGDFLPVIATPQLALAALQAGELESANTWFRKAGGWSRENATGEPIMNALFRRYQQAVTESN